MPAEVPEPQGGSTSDEHRRAEDGATVWQRRLLACCGFAIIIFGIGILAIVLPLAPFAILASSVGTMLVMVIAGLLSIALGILMVAVTRKDPRGGYCPKCNYDLRGGHVKCPECGTLVWKI